MLFFPVLTKVVFLQNDSVKLKACVKVTKKMEGEC